MEDTITTLEDKVAMLVAMGATATKEEARRTLEESGGNIDRAISLLDHVSSSRNVHGAYLHHDDDGVNKRSLVARERVQESLPQRQETRYQGLSTPSFSMMAISTDPSAARRRRDEVDEVDTSGSTNMVESSYQELPSGSQYVNIQKGAFPIHGTNPSVVSDTYSVTPPPQSHEAFAVAARVVDRYEENYEEELRRQEERINQQERELEHFRRTQELQERLRQREEFMENQQKELEELRQGGIVFGEIISRDNDGDEQVDVDTARDNNKRPPASDNMQASSLNRPSSSKRSIVIGLVVILACIGIAVGLVFALRPKSTTEPTEILTTEPTTISSTAPPAAPTSPSSTTADLLSSVSFDEGAALGTPGTPQNMAYNWLVENINIDTYSDKTKIQRYVLATLFYSTNGDSWTANSGWLGNENECGWSGILCTYDSIMELMLSDSNLVGTIPGEIGLLSDSLEMLGLDLNSLTGTIPSTFGMLTSLTDLSLFENKLNGTITSEIGKLTNLPSLELFNNTLRGEIPSEVGQMVDLRYLYLFNNELSGAIPSEVGGMTVLRTLALDGNELTGTIPLEVGRMTSLSNLRLYENSLTGTVPTSIGTLTSLISLSLYANKLSGSIPSEIGLMTIMTSFALYENAIVGRIPSEIGVSSNLLLMNLFGNAFTGSIPSEVGLLTKLTFLNFQANLLTGIIPSELESLTELFYLGLDGNGFSSGYRCSDFIRVCCVSCCDVPEGLVTEDEENFDSPCRQN